jgi:hypothetical protein
VEWWGIGAMDWALLSESDFVPGVRLAAADSPFALLHLTASGIFSTENRLHRKKSFPTGRGC